METHAAVRSSVEVPIGACNSWFDAFAGSGRPWSPTLRAVHAALVASTGVHVDDSANEAPAARRPSLCHDGTPIVYSHELARLDRPGKSVPCFRMLVEPGDLTLDVPLQVDCSLHVLDSIGAVLGWRVGTLARAILAEALPTDLAATRALWGGVWLGMGASPTDAVQGSGGGRDGGADVELRMYANLRHGDTASRWARARAIARVGGVHDGAGVLDGLRATIDDRGVPVGIGVAFVHGRIPVLRLYVGVEEPSAAVLADLTPERHRPTARPCVTCAASIESIAGGFRRQGVTMGYDLRTGQTEPGIARVKYDLSLQTIKREHRDDVLRAFRAWALDRRLDGDSAVEFVERLDRRFGGAEVEFISVGARSSGVGATIYVRPGPRAPRGPSVERDRTDLKKGGIGAARVETSRSDAGGRDPHGFDVSGSDARGPAVRPLESSGSWSDQARSNTMAMRRRAPSMSRLLESCDAARSFLRRAQCGDGCWRDYALEPGVSDAWTTALIACALAESVDPLSAEAKDERFDLPARSEPGGLHGCGERHRHRERDAAEAVLVHRAVVRAARAVAACRRAEGWGYNARTACDADSTAWALRLLAKVRVVDTSWATGPPTPSSATGPPTPSSARTADAPVGEIVHSPSAPPDRAPSHVPTLPTASLLRHVDAAGGVHTFVGERFGRWADAHDDVAAVVGRALWECGDRATARRIADSLLRAGHCRTFWWTTPAYGWARFLELLEAIEEPVIALPRIGLPRINRSALAGGSISDDRSVLANRSVLVSMGIRSIARRLIALPEPRSAFDAAQRLMVATILAARLRSDTLHRLANRLAKTLVTTQLVDGSWRPSPMLRVPAQSFGAGGLGRRPADHPQACTTPVGQLHEAASRTIDGTIHADGARIVSTAAALAALHRYRRSASRAASHGGPGGDGPGRNDRRWDEPAWDGVGWDGAGWDSLRWDGPDRVDLDQAGPFSTNFPEPPALRQPPFEPVLVL